MTSFTQPAGLLGMEAGISLAYRGGTVPAGALLEYGQNVSRTTYRKLFLAIGTTYGAGDGSTTFTLPDSRGRVDAGKDNMGGSAANRVTNGTSGITGTTLGASGGDQRAQTQTVSPPSGNWYRDQLAAGAGWLLTVISDGGTTAGTLNTSGAGASQNMPPTLIANKMITTGGV